MNLKKSWPKSWKKTENLIRVCNKAGCECCGCCCKTVGSDRCGSWVRSSAHLTCLVLDLPQQPQQLPTCFGVRRVCPRTLGLLVADGACLDRATSTCSVCHLVTTLRRQMTYARCRRQSVVVVDFPSRGLHCTTHASSVVVSDLWLDNVFALLLYVSKGLWLASDNRVLQLQITVFLHIITPRPLPFAALARSISH